MQTKGGAQRQGRGIRIVSPPSEGDRKDRFQMRHQTKSDVAEQEPERVVDNEPSGGGDATADLKTRASTPWGALSHSYH